MTKMVYCCKLEKEAPGLDYAPLPGELGQKILDNVSAEAWAIWLGEQTKIINENRLNLADQSSRNYLTQQREIYFNGYRSNNDKNN